MTRYITRIAAVSTIVPNNDQPFYEHTLYATADDGSVWRLDEAQYATTDSEWKKLPSLPLGANHA